MKKIKIFVVTILLLMPLVSVNAYWEPGNEDCKSEHGTGLILAQYVPGAEITLDGVRNEIAWDEAVEFIIPTAGLNNSEFFFISYIFLKIIHCDEYLYISAMWNDSTLEHAQDGISICWNINVEDFSAGMFIDPNLMMTLNPDDVVDNWKWSYAPVGNGSSYKLRDQSFGADGWNDHSDENQDVDSAFTFGKLRDGEDFYHLEMKRSLITDDGEEYDVQFIENGDYYITFAIFSDMGGEDHAISYTWMVNFSQLRDPQETENGIDGYNVIISISLMVIVLFFKIKNK